MSENRLLQRTWEGSCDGYNEKNMRNPPMNYRIVRLKEVQRMTGLSRSTIYAQISRGNFPKQIKLTGARSVGWHEQAVIRWIESRQQA